MVRPTPTVAHTTSLPGDDDACKMLRMDGMAWDGNRDTASGRADTVYSPYVSSARRFILCRAIMSGGVGNYALESDTLSAL